MLFIAHIIEIKKRRISWYRFTSYVPNSHVIVSMQDPRYSNESDCRRQERRITATRSGPFSQGPLWYDRGPSAPYNRAWTSPRCTVKRVRSRVPGSSTGEGEEGRENQRPLRYLLRGCVPSRYYYLYHAHNSSWSLKLFYYLFYTPPLPDSARSPSYTVFFRHPWEHLHGHVFCDQLK